MPSGNEAGAAHHAGRQARRARVAAGLWQRVQVQQRRVASAAQRAHAAQRIFGRRVTRHGAAPANSYSGLQLSLAQLCSAALHALDAFALAGLRRWQPAESRRQSAARDCYVFAACITMPACTPQPTMHAARKLPSWEPCSILLNKHVAHGQVIPPATGR